jgi:hypothetical protein
MRATTEQDRAAKTRLETGKAQGGETMSRARNYTLPPIRTPRPSVERFKGWTMDELLAFEDAAAAAEPMIALDELRDRIASRSTAA